MDAAQVDSVASTALELIRTLSGSAPLGLDLTDRAHLDVVREMADVLQRAVDSSAELRPIEAEVAPEAGVPLSVRVAVKLAISRLCLAEIEEPVHVSVVLAVYKEHVRILRGEEHPAGEDFLREKLRQLRWLFGPTRRHGWDLTVVDDGCPEGSGRLAEEVLEEFTEPGEEARVLYLEDALRRRLPITGALKAASESQKGGSIRYGLWDALQTRRDGKHLALFTDADLSTHLGQIGLMAAPFADPAVFAAVGSRREPTSVVVKRGGRNDRGKLFIYLWKRLLPQLRGIVDTQCGFKAFDADDLRSWIEEVQDDGFSFDVEMLLRLQLRSPGSARRVPIAWIDSEAASTTAELEPYLPMLHNIARLYRTALPWSAESEPFAEVVEKLDDRAFRTLTSRIPSEILDREPIVFDTFAGVSAEELASAAGL